MEAYAFEPFKMNNFVKRFGEKICRVLDTQNMMNVNNTLIDTGVDEMCSNVNMFHF